jgi:hypothetical protein
MSDLCRVDTDALKSAAGDIEKQKPIIDRTNTEAGATTLPLGAFGRVEQSGPAAQAHTATVKQVGQQLEAASGEITKLAELLRGWKTKYETDTRRALQCLINLGRPKQ